MAVLAMAFCLQLPLSAAKRHESSSSSSSSSSHDKSHHGSSQGKWEPLKNQPTFLQGGASNQLQLTDGTILVGDAFCNADYSDVRAYPDIWKLTPDAFGSYINGTWSQLPSLPTIPSYINWPIQYSCRPAPNVPNDVIWAPWGMYSGVASAVLADGRVVVCGGENNGVNQDFVLTNMCAIYDPFANTWTPLNPPPFVIDQQTDPAIINPPRSTWAPNAIGDSCSVILEDGKFLLAPKMSNQGALLNPKTLQWTEVGTSTNPAMNDEQALTLLPNGKVLTIQCYVGQHFAPAIYGPFPSDLTGSLLFNPKTKTWSSAGSTIVPLSDTINFEMGPAVLRPDGKVVCFSGNGTGENVIFDSKTETWSVTAQFPSVPGNEGQLSCADSGAVLLPNGNVLVCAYSYYLGWIASPYVPPPLHFFEFTHNANKLIEQPTISNENEVGASNVCLMILPTGQAMAATQTTNVQIYTPGDRSYNPNWAPVITESPKKVKAGHTYKIKGIRFNGMSQATGYGDDYQSATNYPLVRITNKKTKHVKYCRTHDHSFMGVASNKKVHTYFDVPRDIDLGCSKIEVVANGIPSKPVCVIVKKE
jgi:hypothetical protein